MSLFLNRGVNAFTEAFAKVVIEDSVAPEADSIDKAEEHQQIKDRDAFATLYETYKKPLWKRLLYLIGNKDAAYDLLQETFLHAWKGLPRKSPDAPFELWLYNIAKNLAIDHLRRHTTTLEHISLPTNEAEESSFFSSFYTPGHEDLVCRRECLKEALAQMSPQYRVCVLLQEVWGYSQREIAVSLNISEKGVSANVSRGRAQLRMLYRKIMSEQDATGKGE